MTSKSFENYTSKLFKRWIQKPDAAQRVMKWLDTPRGDTALNEMFSAVIAIRTVGPIIEDGRVVNRDEYLRQASRFYIDGTSKVVMEEHLEESIRNGFLSENFGSLKLTPTGEVWHTFIKNVEAEHGQKQFS